MKHRKKAPNGAGSVWKRPNGTWAGGLYVYESDGVRRRRWVYGKTRQVVLDKLADLRRKEQGNVPITPKYLTVGRYLHEWLEEIVADRVRERTLNAYRYNVETYLEPDLGAILLGDLTARQVRQHLDRLRRRGVGTRTIRYAHATLRAALADAMREELIEKNVATLVRAPSVPRSEPNPLTVDELKAWFTANKDDRLFALLVVIALLGLRRSEALGLHWDDVDLHQETLSVTRGLQRVNGHLVELATKTVRSRRTIPLPRFVAEALTQHQAQQHAEWADLGLEGRPEHVFTTSLGTPLDPDNTTKFVQRSLKTAGLRKVRMHDFRHGCVSALLALGVPPRTVMEIAGHSGLEMTMNVYAHVSMAEKREALSKLDDLFGPRD